MDSSAESDIESGDRQFNTKTPSKRTRESEKTPARKLIDTAGFDGIKLFHFIIIRCVQCF